MKKQLLTIVLTVFCIFSLGAGYNFMQGKNFSTGAIKAVNVDDRGNLVTSCHCVHVAEGKYDDLSCNVATFTKVANTTNTLLGEVFGTAETYSFLVTAETLYVSSSSAEDASGGSGIYKVDISGLDDDYNVTTETLTITGQTAVATANEYLRINSMNVSLTDLPATGEVNTGDIYIYRTGEISAGVPDNLNLVLNGIGAGKSISRSCVFTVPANQTWYITSNSFLAGFSSNTTFQLKSRIYDGYEYENVLIPLSAANSSFIYTCTFPITEKTDIYAKVQTSSGTNTVSGFIEWIKETN